MCGICLGDGEPGGSSGAHSGQTQSGEQRGSVETFYSETACVTPTPVMLREPQVKPPVPGTQEAGLTHRKKQMT